MPLAVVSLSPGPSVVVRLGPPKPATGSLSLSASETASATAAEPTVPATPAVRRCKLVLSVLHIALARVNSTVCPPAATAHTNERVR